MLLPWGMAEGYFSHPQLAVIMSSVDRTSPEQQRLNTEKSFSLASALFPGEEWVFKEPNIWVARSRLPEEYREKDKWGREMSQVRILTNRGSIAYFLPELNKGGEAEKLCADLVLDGIVMEMKTVTGTRATLGTEFRFAYRQGAVLLSGYPGIEAHSVFIRLKSDLSVGSVKAKIAGELKNRTDPGDFVCYFENIGQLYAWNYEELKAIIGTKKSPGPD
ncbi:hypothetical protein FACS189491_12190 [Spirochaetia bacterium]|nr:hypothetical protein FACS189491_12190 [Spirochaetia bacterium]